MSAPESVDRLPLWRALSELFLDVECTADTRAYIARTVRDCGLPLAEVERVLWHEVFPVLSANFRSLAGEWAGWSDDWLLHNVQINDQSGPPRGSRGIVRAVRSDWQAVLQRLQENV